MSLKSIQLNSAIRSFVLPAFVLVCLLLVYFVVKWCLANTVAANADQKELAQIAADWAPSDPLPHYALAVWDEKSFLPEDFTKAIGEYEKAVALSPNDYRRWFALGRARERNGDAEGAETALRRTLELAPNYAHVQWALGNVLLRRGKTDEGFTEIRKAVAGEASFAAPAISIAWQIYEGNAAEIVKAVGDSTPAKAALSVTMAKEKLYDEAFNAWNSLPDADKSETYRQQSTDLLNSLLQAKKFRRALEVQAQINPPDREKPVIEKITNPGFESNVVTTGAGTFEWQIADGTQPLISVDEKQKRGGNRSLVIVFNSPNGQDFRAVQQTIAVEPGKTYKFTVFSRSELKASGSVKWEILDAAEATSGKILASTEAAQSNASDWSQMTAVFTAPAGTEAVTIRLARAACTSAVCPLSGKIWFDDFSLESSAR